MTLLVCYIIAYVQILSAGFHLWGVDPLIIFSMPFGRNSIFVGLYMVAQLLGLVGAIMILQKELRLGFILSIVHHVLLLPALVITSMGLVMMMDDRINVTLLFMSDPRGSDVGLYWSLGWGTVFDQVTGNVPRGATYFGINLFAFFCATVLWVGMDETEEAIAAREMQMRRRPKRPKRAPLALPAPEPYPQPQRMPAQQRARQQQRSPYPQQDMKPPPRRQAQQGARQSPRMPPSRGGLPPDWPDMT